MKAPHQLLIAAMLLLAVPGCSSDTVGPCSVTKIGPALELTAVTNSQTGDPLDSVIIEDIVVDGYAPARIPDAGLSPYDAGRADDSGDADGGMQSNTLSYRCDLPCGVTDIEGEVEFTLRADGYEPKDVATTSDYQAARGGGCPTTLSDGRTIELELEPRSQQ